jgi:hypothetical protein
LVLAFTTSHCLLKISKKPFFIFVMKNKKRPPKRPFPYKLVGSTNLQCVT